MCKEQHVEIHTQTLSWGVVHTVSSKFGTAPTVIICHHISDASALASGADSSMDSDAQAELKVALSRKVRCHGTGNITLPHMCARQT